MSLSQILFASALVLTAACSAEMPTRPSIKSSAADAESNTQAGGKPPKTTSGTTPDKNNDTNDSVDMETDPIVAPDDKPVIQNPVVINETGGSLDNNAVAIPMPADDSGAEIDPFKAPRMIMSLGTEECLDLDDNSNHNGEVIQSRPCNGGTAQVVEFKKLSGDYVSMNFLASKGCFKLEDASPEKRTIVHQWKCVDEAAQKWKMVKVSANTYIFRPALNDMRCIDMDTNGPKTRSTIQIYDCNGSPQQSFRLVRKDKNFVPKAAVKLSLDEVCHHKIRVYEDDSTAAGKLVYETLGGRFMDRVPELAKETCKLLFTSPEQVKAKINYMSVFVESKLPNGEVATTTADVYKKAIMKFGSDQFQAKKNANVDITQFLKGTLVEQLSKIFVYPVSDKANAKLKVIANVLPFTLRLNAGYPDASWKRTKTGTWDQGGLSTGLFLAYIESKNQGFIRKLNAQLSAASDEKLIMTLTGTSVDALWTAYQNDAGCSAQNLVCGK